MATGFNINNFRSNGLTYGGSRPAYFQAIITPPTALGGVQGANKKFSLQCSAAKIPGMEVGEIPVSYFGRRINVAGDRNINDLIVTLMNDNDYLVRSMLEAWSNSLNSLESNIRNTVYSGQPEMAYKGSMQLIHYRQTGEVIRSIDVLGIFPTQIEEMDLNWEAQNRINTYSVRFSMDYFLPTPGSEQAISYLSAATTPIAS